MRSIPLAGYNPRRLNIFTPEDYGAVGDGTTDDYTAFVNCINAIVSAGGGILKCRRSTYKINTAITIDVYYVKIDGGFGTLDFSSAETGPALTLYSSHEYGNAVCGVENLIVHGTRTAGHDGIQFGDTTDGHYGSFISLRNVVVRYFDSNITYSNNTWNNTLYNCELYEGNLLIDFPSGLTNSGERLDFIGCTFFNCTAIANVDGGYVYFSDCSFDYPSTYILKTANGWLNNCFIELDTDGDYLFEVSWGDPRASISLNNCSITLQGNRASYVLGNCASGSSGIVGRGNVLYNNATYTAGSYFTGPRDIEMLAGNIDDRKGLPRFAYAAGTHNTTNTTLTTITGMSQTVQANCVYEYEVRINNHVSADTTGIGYGINFSSTGATIDGSIYGTSTSGASKAEGMGAFDTTSTAFMTTSSGYGTVLLKGLLYIGANPGTVNIRHRKVTSGTATAYDLASFKLTRISP